MKKPKQAPQPKHLRYKRAAKRGCPVAQILPSGNGARARPPRSAAEAEARQLEAMALLLRAVLVK